MGKKEQRKGADGERELAAILAGFGFETQRGGSLTYGSVPDIVGLPGVHIECKRQERLDLMGAIRQAETDAQRFRDGMPAVFHRKNRCKWLVTMPLYSWMELYKAAEKQQEAAKISNEERGK